ncbi:MAG: hypothetical protein HQL69_22735 [Magnetococcales bacterium]|nr:hypothetical protein [Magnetococcales bacterium]
MALEINEINIQMQVDDSPMVGKEVRDENSFDNSDSYGLDGALNQEEIIQECVLRIMRQLKDMGSR